MSEDEIENALIRSPLTPAQEASAIFRRKAIYEGLHPETKATYAGGSFKGNQHGAVTDNLSAANFANATAHATGKDERTIRRAAARGEALGDDLGAVTGTSLEKGVELDALAKTNRVKRSGRLFNGHGVSFRFIGGLEENTNFEGSLVDELRCFRA